MVPMAKTRRTLQGPSGIGITRMLDIRDLEPANRHERVHEAFEDLEPGGSLTIVNDHDPTPLLYELDSMYPLFDQNKTTVEQVDRNRFEAHLKKLEEANSSPDEEIVELLRSVSDPELEVNVVDAGIVQSVELATARDGETNTAILELVAAGLGDGNLDRVEEDIRETLEAHEAVDEVTIRRQGGGYGVNEGEVWDRLSDVQHPDLGIDVVEAEVISDIEASGGAVTLELDPSAFEQGLDDVRGEFIQLLGQAAYNATAATQVEIRAGRTTVPIDPPGGEDPPLAESPGAAGPPGMEGGSPLAQGMDQGTSASPTLDITGIDEILLVASAKGGVGKTTVATQLARGLASDDWSVGLLDADFAGPDIPQLLDLERSFTEGAVIDPVERDGMDVMSVGLMEGRPKAWNGEMVQNALFNLLEDIDWDVDTLVVDLPPGASDTLMTFLQFVPIAGVVLVTTPYPTSIDDTNEGAVLFREGDVPILGVVANMVGFVCPTCGDEHELFPATDIEAALDHPVLAELPFDPDIRTFDGSVPQPIRHLADTVTKSMPDEGSIEVPETAVDVRDAPEHGRYELVDDAFHGIEPGETLTVVSDHNPAGFAIALVDQLGLERSPSDVFEEYQVSARRSDEWVLQIRKPEPSELEGAATE